MIWHHENHYNFVIGVVFYILRAYNKSVNTRHENSSKSVRSVATRDEYLQCLDLLWRELENHFSEKDVCVPILGAGTTSFDGGSGASISQQDLLNMMIWSYKLSSHKIKAPHKLRIVCKKNSGFSINRIDN
ncbi:MAG: macro domain-containing protein [Faecousia sp.]